MIEPPPTRMVGARIATDLAAWLEGWCERTGWTRSAAVEQGLRLLRDQYPLGVPAGEGLGERAHGTRGDPAAASLVAHETGPAQQTPPAKPSGPDPAVARERRIAGLSTAMIMIRARDFSRSAARVQDGRAYLREVVRRSASDQGVRDPELSDEEADRILNGLAEKSPTIQRILKGETD